MKKMVVAIALLFAVPLAFAQGAKCSDVQEDRARLKCYDSVDGARIVAAQTDVHLLMQALKLYYLDNKRYPTVEQGLDALKNRPTVGPPAPGWKKYVERLPLDPWGREYEYRVPGRQGAVEVFSLGPPYKKQPIGSWE
jgi:general secretion pathway protein G